MENNNWFLLNSINIISSSELQKFFSSTVLVHHIDSPLIWTLIILIKKWTFEFSCNFPGCQGRAGPRWIDAILTGESFLRSTQTHSQGSQGFVRSFCYPQPMQYNIGTIWNNLWLMKVVPKFRLDGSQINLCFLIGNQQRVFFSYTRKSKILLMPLVILIFIIFFSVLSDLWSKL